MKFQTKWEDFCKAVALALGNQGFLVSSDPHALGKLVKLSRDGHTAEALITPYMFFDNTPDKLAERIAQQFAAKA